jgi:hypothetical protein
LPIMLQSSFTCMLTNISPFTSKTHITETSSRLTNLLAAKTLVFGLAGKIVCLTTCIKMLNPTKESSTAP